MHACMHYHHYHTNFYIVWDMVISCTYHDHSCSYRVHMHIHTLCICMYACIHIYVYISSLSVLFSDMIYYISLLLVFLLFEAWFTTCRAYHVYSFSTQYVCTVYVYIVHTKCSISKPARVLCNVLSAAWNMQRMVHTAYSRVSHITYYIFCMMWCGASRII